MIINSLLMSNDVSSKIEKLIFTQNEYLNKLNWKDEEEFEFRGEMYDVLKTEISGNNITAYCLRDEKEEELISNYEKLFRENNVKDKVCPELVSLINFHFLAIQNEISSQGRIGRIMLLPGNYINNYVSINKESHSPPPKHFLNS